ncbi:MAG: hypothetical protein PUC32_07805 [Oscillospiraceae bacterium]|nr:hypothetical protein [Oscillospiraceae bacterium]
MEEKKETFQYTYSAKEQEELRKIRRKYQMAEQEDKLEQLRRLDRSVTQKGTIVSMVVGILGTLLMGVGMTCVMVWKGVLFLPGIFIGIAGILLVLSAYPLYTYWTKKEREKVAPEILRLTDELLK